MFIIQYKTIRVYDKFQDVPYCTLLHSFQEFLVPLLNQVLGTFSLPLFPKHNSLLQFDLDHELFPKN